MYTVNYEDVEQACYDADLDPENALHLKYSGRFMYGESCLGLVHDTQGELLKFAISLVREDEDAADWLDRTRSDSMGRSMITYWPGVTVEDAPEYEDDEDDEAA